MSKVVVIAVVFLVAVAAWAGSGPLFAATAAVPTAPVLKQKVVPFAPASGSGWTVGCVLLQYDVSSAGVPENVRVLDSAPDHVLDRLAVSTLTQWRYQPATRDGRAVAAQGFKQMLSFHAPGSSAPPPYRLCGGSASNENPISGPAPVSRVNLDITRPAVVQTFEQAAQSTGFMPRKGQVSVSFCVNPQGRTENLRIVRSVPVGVFDRMALGFMSAAVFKPHEVHGVAVTACGITQPIVFEAASAH